MKRRRGFTFIELSVVLTILALFTTLAVVSFREPYQKIRFRNTIEQIDFWQTLQRKQCRRARQPQILIMDFEAQKLQVGNGASPSQCLTFQGGMVVDQLIVSGKVSNQGTTAMMIGVDGQCETFALHLSGPFQQTRWLLFAGTTGQMTELDSAEQVHGALALLSP
ncbi:MAG: type II secretion system protein [Pirellulaceae bacterium]